jgi:hypothetical protein
MFESVADGRKSVPKAEVVVPFAELDDASDPLLLGFPLLMEWGLKIEVDADGHIWVEFLKLGVTMLAERPSGEGY